MPPTTAGDDKTFPLVVSDQVGVRPPTLPRPRVVSAGLVPRWSVPRRNCGQSQPQLATATLTLGLVLAR